MTSPNITDAHVPKLNNKGEPTRNDMTEHEVIKRDAIRLAAVVVNLSKKYRPFQAEATEHSTPDNYRTWSTSAKSFEPSTQGFWHTNVAH